MIPEVDISLLGTQEEVNAGQRGDWRVEKTTYAGNSAVDLCSILALWVRVLWGGHLQHAHSKGIHIHWLVVLLLIHLRRHELRGTLNQNNYSELPYWLSGLLTTHCSSAPLTHEGLRKRRMRRLTSLLKSPGVEPVRWKLEERGKRKKKKRGKKAKKRENKKGGRSWAQLDCWEEGTCLSV